MSAEPLARWRRVGMVARFKPVHLGHAAVLAALAEHADRLVLGIGSANRHDLRNPFSAAESADMLRLVLGESGADLIELEDLGDGPRWRAMVVERFGPLDRFATANPYVAELLREDYHLIHPAALVPRERQVALTGAMVRRAMARSEAWRELVPPEVAAYLDERGLVARFRREFGDAALASDG